MAYRIAIVDDNKKDLEFVQNLLTRWSSDRQVSVQTALFPSAESFLFHYAEDKAWDILLLDIEMGAMDGVTMAKQVRRDNEAVQIVFVTGYSDYIAEGYEVAALHYLMKPVNGEKLFTVLDRALEKRKQEERCLNLELSGEMVRIPFYEIRYLDVRQNYVTVHGRNEYTVKRSLGEFEKELDDRFYRAGRSLIVNLKHIQRVTRTEVRLSDGTALPLPRGAYEPLNRAIIART
ncbi:MAG: response regulator transcription factor [Lachnospiraceae bacterium]|nr:response regulator transcription factor [Lachnospiraceae bacterium]